MDHAFGTFTFHRLSQQLGFDKIQLSDNYRLMCTDYEGPKPEQKAEIERKIRQEVFGFVPRAQASAPPTPAPLILPVERCFSLSRNALGLDRAVG